MRPVAEPEAAEDGAAAHRRCQDRKAAGAGVEHVGGKSWQQLAQRQSADAQRDQQHQSAAIPGAPPYECLPANRRRSCVACRDGLGWRDADNASATRKRQLRALAANAADTPTTIAKPANMGPIDQIEAIQLIATADARSVSATSDGTRASRAGWLNDHHPRKQSARSGPMSYGRSRELRGGGLHQGNGLARLHHAQAVPSVGRSSLSVQ